MAYTSEANREYHQQYREDHRDEHRLWARGHYLSNKEKYAQWGRVQQLRRKAWMDGIKSCLGCFVCGEDRPWRLVWHHLSPADKTRKVSEKGGLEVTLREMCRCVVLCGNCHLDIHHELSMEGHNES